MLRRKKNRGDEKAEKEKKREKNNKKRREVPIMKKKKKRRRPHNGGRFGSTDVGGRVLQKNAVAQWDKRNGEEHEFVCVPVRERGGEIAREGKGTYYSDVGEATRSDKVGETNLKKKKSKQKSRRGSGAEGSG